jgi:diguanylate cyclase (GGDEF)-like protein
VTNKPDAADRANQFDNLTNLLSLSYFASVLSEGEGGVLSGPCSIVYINVPNFKAFNKTYGFLNGDEFLKMLGQAIRNAFPDELVCRETADRFIVFLRSVDKELITDAVKSIQTAVSKHERGMKLSIKAGVRCETGSEINPTALVERAKAACEHISDKEEVDLIFHTDELDRELGFQHYIITGFDNAIKKGYIQPFYQREIRTLTDQCCGYEALARWVDPDYGMISPGVFVPILEHAKLIHKLDLHIIRQVCSDIRTLLDRGQPAQPVSVNLSRLDFQLADMFEEVEKCRKEFNLPVSYLNIEITESAVAEVIVNEIKRFRDAGYQLWMDDFGSGYSSLNNLKDYDFDVIKIDMAFLRQMQDNPKAKVILAAVVGMAKDLGIHTLAEGVETREQFEFLKSVGCERIQGFLFGKPMAFDRSNCQQLSFVNETPDHEPPESENCALHEYFEKIGGVNVIGNAPLEDKHQEVTYGIATAIVEVVGDTVRCLYANEACLEFFRSLGVRDAKEADHLLNTVGRIRVTKLLVQTAQRSEQSGKSESVDCLINGNVCNVNLRFIARSGDRAACVVVPKNINGMLEKHQDNDVQKALTYMLSMFFRIDLFDVTAGRVKNIYLSAEQDRITDTTEETITAVRRYADNYIAERDRKRFCTVYDMSTIQDRILKARGRTLVEYFHSAGPMPQLQKYCLILFQLGREWKVLSCCMELGTTRELAVMLDEEVAEVADSLVTCEMI